MLVRVRLDLDDERNLDGPETLPFDNLSAIDVETRITSLRSFYRGRTA